MTFVSEELLPGIKEINRKTTTEELIAIVDSFYQKYNVPPCRQNWENLADAAFLAFSHKKTENFRFIVFELIATIFAAFGEPIEEVDAAIDSMRACCLTCSDAPKNPRVICYMLGHLKGKLTACRKQYEERMNGKAKKRIDEHLNRRVFRNS